MSPTKKPGARLHARADIVTAVAVGVGIVVATAFLIWALRPANPGVPGTGGIMARQSRFWLWLVLALGVLAWAIWWVRNGKRRPRRVTGRTAVLVAVIVVGVIALLGAIFWPDGLIEHYPSSAVTNETPDTTPETAPAPATVPASTIPATQPRATTPPTTKGP